MSENKSDGSTASYYELPPKATELQHLISHRNMNAQIGEIFRACYRYGMASHSDQLRDAKKILFYAKAEVERLEALPTINDWMGRIVFTGGPLMPAPEKPKRDPRDVASDPEGKLIHDPSKPLAAHMARVNKIVRPDGTIRLGDLKDLMQPAKTGRDLYIEYCAKSLPMTRPTWCELSDEDQADWNARAKEQA